MTVSMDLRTLEMQRRSGGTFAPGFPFDEFLDLSDAGDTNIVNVTGSGDVTAQVQGIFDSYAGVQDLTLVFASGTAYTLGELTWSGSKKLKIRATGATISTKPDTNTVLSVTGVDAFVLDGGTWDGNYSNQVENVNEWMKIRTSTIATLVLIQNATFKDTISGCMIIRSEPNTQGAANVGVRDCTFQQIYMPAIRGGAIQGSAMSLQFRSNLDRVFVSNCEFDRCSCMDAGKTIGFTADTLTAADEIGRCRIEGCSYDRCGGIYFAQKFAELVVANNTATRQGVWTDEIAYSANFGKIDDSTRPGVTETRAIFSDIVATTSGTIPLFKVAETVGDTLNVFYKNINTDNGFGQDGGTVAIGLIYDNCTTRGNSAFGSSSRCAVWRANCGAVVTIRGDDNRVFESTFNNVSIQSGTAILVHDCDFTDQLNMLASAECTVDDCRGTNSCRVTMGGNNQRLSNSVIQTDVFDEAVIVGGDAASGIEIVDCTLVSLERFGINGVIELVDSENVEITGNDVSGSAQGRIERQGTTHTLSGTIDNNLGATYVNMPGWVPGTSP